MIHDHTPNGPHQADVLEARFGLRVTHLLHEGAQELPHDVSERLRVARLQAVERARQRLAQTRRSSAQESHVVSLGNGTAALSHGAPHLPMDQESWWTWAGSLVPLLALLLGLMTVSVMLDEEDVQAAAQVDVELLSDDLPPAAYSDPGFTEFLQTPTEGTPALPRP